MVGHNVFPKVLMEKCQSKIDHALIPAMILKFEIWRKWKVQFVQKHLMEEYLMKEYSMEEYLMDEYLMEEYLMEEYL